MWKAGISHSPVSSIDVFHSDLFVQINRIRKLQSLRSQKSGLLAQLDWSGRRELMF